MEHKLHPAVTVTNIRSFIPIILDSESAQYTTWSALFKIHCTAFLVSDHLSPRPQSPSASSSSTTTTDKSSADPPLDSWERLDAIVLQWIYGTISTDLLQTILKPTATASDAWLALKSLFHDNKPTRALYLKQKFSNTRLENFTNVSAYCQELKVLSDQLTNVDAPVDDQSLVLQALSGITDQFEGIATVIQNTKPLPSFSEVRSQLCMYETRKINQARHNSATDATALHAQTKPAQTPLSAQPQNQTHQTSYPSDRGRGRGRNSRGRGRGSWNRGRSYPPSSFQPWQTYPSYSPQPATLHDNPSWSPWAAPPCPYPTTNATAAPPPGHAGLLGPRPNHAHMACTPTNIEQAMYTMSLNPPDWNAIMDTGASTHMHQPSGPQDPDPYFQVQQQR